MAVAVALVLKPVLTALSTETAAGSLVALSANHFGGRASIALVALVGGAAVPGVAQNAPVFAVVFTAELTHPPVPVRGVLRVTALGACVLCRMTSRGHRRLLRRRRR